jgi:3-oxosteroid 1-dehydrogenase
MTDTIKWDHTVDVLVVGSGGGAMVAAIRAKDNGAETLVIEKTDKYGGNTAMSGGVIWVPNSHLMAAKGLQDSAEKGFQYLKSLIGDAVPDARIRSYVEKAPEMLKWLHDKTAMRFESLELYPDYYPGSPGYMEGGRSHDPKAFNAAQLGDEFENLRGQHPQTLIYNIFTMETMEFRAVFKKEKGWVGVFMRVFFEWLFDLGYRLKFKKRSRRLTLGNSVAGSLRKSMLDRKIPLWLNCGLKELIVEDGKVVGAVAEKNGQPFRIRAKKGVILGAGGFERNQQMREQYLPGPTHTSWTTGSPGNTGDAHRAGISIGADIKFMDDAWWGPTVVVPGEAQARMMIVEKSLPGCAFVDMNGKRYTDEAAPYITVVQDMYKREREGTQAVPSWMIFGKDYREKYPCGPVFPGEMMKDTGFMGVPPELWDSYIFKAETVEDLAQKIGISNVANLKQTIVNMNEYAKTGKDLEYDKGGNEYDRFYGDDQTGFPNPCLMPIEAPYYAVKVHAGELGTKGGLNADEKARVLDKEGKVIPGLYVIGNNSAALMGPTYAGAGSTIGPAMTFGYIAADDVMGK